MTVHQRLAVIAAVVLVVALAGLVIFVGIGEKKHAPEWTPAQKDACQTEADRGQDAGTVALDRQSYIDAVADCLVRVTGH